MDKLKILNEIKGFLDGYNDDLKYIVNVETDPNENVAECIVQPPNEEKRIIKVQYTPFMYMKDLAKNDRQLYDNGRLLEEKKIQYGIKIEKLKTGNQKRLENGFCYKLSSYKSRNHIIKFLKETNLNPYEKIKDENGKLIKNKKGDPIYKNGDLFYSPRLEEQFLINKSARLYKGFEEYNEVHRVVFDIETTGLRPEISRMFSIGIKDNRGFEKVLEVRKINDDQSERELIRDFFNIVDILNPAIISGYNSEDFDFYYVLSRAEILNVDITKLKTTLKKEVPIKRRPNSSVKIGGNTEKYTSTKIWGRSVTDTLFAVKRTAAINSDIKETNLKYIAKFEKIAKENRTYIKGEDNSIGRYYHENPFFVANDKNEHIEIPLEFHKTIECLYKAQQHKKELTKKDYNKIKKYCLDKDPEFVKWYKEKALSANMTKFTQGRKLVKQYLLDDIYETYEIDELYNQSSFMLTKIVPTTYERICTMGTASVWNLLLTAWSYERGLAIPYPDKYMHFSGGLARCYKKGYTERLVKIDYASLYPMLQLTHDIFPIFDISNVMKKMLIYMTTTRNIYKKLAKDDNLNEEEIELMKGIDHEGYLKYTENKLFDKDKNIYGVKEKPIKILNNSQFGALGANIAFNWSDNECAARITACGRIELRHAIKWFEQFGCTSLYAVTDGVNFKVPDFTHIIVNENTIDTSPKDEDRIEEMWKYNGETGINALIAYFNDHEMKKPFMAADNDGEFVSCFNLARINYAVLEEKKDKNTGELKRKVKYTGNSIKSSVMPEYIEDFYDEGFKMILEGKGYEFVEYYYEYAQDIFYKQIPLKKIASKSRYKNTIKEYLNRGKDKNGREKGKQAHMELVIKERNKIAENLFEKHKDSLDLKKNEEELTIDEKIKLVEVYMPLEPELDSTLYYYNTGYRKSHGDSREIKDKKTGEMRYASKLISKEEIIENPDLKGDYNIDKYLSDFNKKVEAMLVAFDPEIAEKIPVKIKREKVKDEYGNKVEEESLIMNQFTKDQLELKSFDLDDVESSLYLEEFEVNFWNQSGYDPRLVWDGFKMHDDMKVHYEIYQNALDYVNEKMKKANKPLVKSRNEKIDKGNYVLIKSGPEYSIGYHNGEFIEIIRENIEIPKTEIEIGLDEKTKKENEKSIEKLKGIEFKSEEEAKIFAKEEKRKHYYPLFKKQFKIPNETYEDFYKATEGKGVDIIDKFIVEKENELEDQNADYLGVD